MGIHCDGLSNEQAAITDMHDLSLSSAVAAGTQAVGCMRPTQQHAFSQEAA
jgi:hypothetical protein